MHAQGTNTIEHSDDLLGGGEKATEVGWIAESGMKRLVSFAESKRWGGGGGAHPDLIAALVLIGGFSAPSATFHLCLLA